MFAILAAAVIGSVLGASLALAAFWMEASDEFGDWRTRSRGFKAAAVVSVAVLAAISAELALWLAPGWQVGIGLAAFAAAGPGMSVIDVASRRLPFTASSTVALAAGVGLVFTPELLWRGLLAGAVTAVVMVMLSLASKGRAGGGDVVFAAVAALTLAWAGWMAVVLAVASGMVLTGLAGLALRWAGRGEALAPFGPFLLAVIITVWSGSGPYLVTV
ncbi:prepilin peptidase, partial [Glycomyces paridis]